MVEENHAKIYEILSKILGIKFKTQLNGTEIFFKAFYRMNNLIKNEEKYLLIIEDKKSILFTDKKDFLEQFLLIVKLNIKYLDDEFNELKLQEQSYAKIDENEVFHKHEHIGYCGERLQKLLNKLQEFQKSPNK